MTIDLNQTAQTFEQILLTEQSSPITNRGDIGASKLRRKELYTLLGEIQAVGNALSSAIYNLPGHPNEKYMDWAEGVLSLFNLAIVATDTTSLNESADIIRIYALSGGGNPLCDVIIRPQRELTANTAYTGISQQSLDIAPTIEEAWDAILREIKGHYIVSFNLDFVESRLKNNIEHYGLERLPIIGACLMKQAKSYFGIEDYGYRSGLKLPDACARIGHQLATPALAADRAAGQLALLKAMAQGVTSVAAPDASTLSELDDHPF